MVSLYGPNATKAQTMQDFYKELALNKEGVFEVDFPATGTTGADDLFSAYEQSRVMLLTLFRNGLKALNARDGKSIIREYYPTPSVATPFFDEVDMGQALAYANMMLNPRDPYFAMAVTDGEVGALRILGDIINIVNKYADARTAFVLLRMFVRPVREGDKERMITDFPFDERKNMLRRRRNSVLAVTFRADNNFLTPELMKKYAGEEDNKLLNGVINSFDQNALRLNLTELQHSRWLFVLLNGLDVWKGGMTLVVKEGLTNLVLAFNSAQKPEEIAIKIDAFVDTINPLPKEGEQQEQQ